MKNVVKVLSIDGGGIRGIIPAKVLAAIEKITRKPIARLFDLIAGTSTGGILALGLTKPDASGAPQYPAEDLVGFYDKEGSRIFSRSLWHRVCALGDLHQEKYSCAGIDSVLKEYFGDARLKDAATDVLVPSYEIERRFAFFFKSSTARVKPDYDFAMRDVARATSAAPTYFEPQKLQNGTSDYYALIDGGVFANNPAACALVEARTTHPGAEQFLVVSLGTGAMTLPIPYVQAKNWGLARWAKPLLDVVFDGVSSTVDYQLTQLLPEHNYYRLQTTLNRYNQRMDNTSPRNITALKSLADKLIDDRAEDIASLCDSLTHTTEK